MPACQPEHEKLPTQQVGSQDSVQLYLRSENGNGLVRGPTWTKQECLVVAARHWTVYIAVRGSKWLSWFSEVQEQLWHRRFHDRSLIQYTGHVMQLSAQTATTFSFCTQARLEEEKVLFLSYMTCMDTQLELYVTFVHKLCFCLLTED